MTAEVRNDVIVATEHIEAPPDVVLYRPRSHRQLDRRPGRARPAVRRRVTLDMGGVLARGAFRTVEPPHRVVLSWAGSDTLPPAGRPSRSCSPRRHDGRTHAPRPAAHPHRQPVHRLGPTPRRGRLIQFHGGARERPNSCRSCYTTPTDSQEPRQREDRLGPTGTPLPGFCRRSIESAAEYSDCAARSCPTQEVSTA